MPGDSFTRVVHVSVSLALLFSVSHWFGSQCAGQNADEVPVIAEATFSIKEDVFERVAQTKNQPVERMETALQRSIEMIDRRCHLTDAQERKLRLAGRGDIRGWQQRVSNIRATAVGKPVSRELHEPALFEMQQLGNEVSYGPHGDESLFQKTLNSVLTSEQHDRYSSFDREFREQQLNQVWAFWDKRSKSVRLSPHASELNRLILEKAPAAASRSPYQNYIVLFQVAELEAEVRPLLGDLQWEELQLLLSYSPQVQPMLRRLGKWPLKSNKDSE